MDIHPVEVVNNEFESFGESESTAIESAQTAIRMAGILPGDLHNREVGGDYPIFLAISAGDHDAIEGYLTDPDQIGVKGDTPLSLAVEIGDLVAVRILVGLGANPDLPNGKGVTPRQLADELGLDLFN